MSHTTIPASDASTSTALVGWWTSADGQGSIDMTGATAQVAVEELLRQCASDEARADILGGAFDLLPAADAC